jgi:hypothetical protein
MMSLMFTAILASFPTARDSYKIIPKKSASVTLRHYFREADWDITTTSRQFMRNSCRSPISAVIRIVRP